MSDPISPDQIQLPDTPAEKRAALQQLLVLFPDTLPDHEMEELIRRAVSVIQPGCRSAAELNSRATVLSEEFGYVLTPAQLTTALLSLLFARVPVSVEDEQQLTALLVKESGGVVGYDADQVPGGSGPFGIVPTNPVPVAGIVSSALYLRRLRLPDGRPVEWRRTGSRTAAGIDNPVDCYRVTDANNQLVAEVFISPYHQRISGRAPAGLVLSPLRPESWFE
ncbi:hypothetical protein [Hymenobacter sp. 102]|uniref:hypothetical protein n=1 Tax=Hymenobacter sp. 102 TaxID=3403152 RepID=UPI003CF33074